jgi:lysophospholipase L1-like esterase
VVCNDADWAKSQLAIVVGKSLTAEEANALLRSFACPDDVKKRLDLLVQEVAASNDGAEAARVLTAHLLKIATLIRKAGAVPVFLNYPLPLWSDRYCGPLESVAEEIDIPFLDVAAGFMKRLGSRSLEEVLSADGHVIDEGYRMMAECVAEGLEPLLRSLK